MSTQTVRNLKPGDYLQLVGKNGLQKAVYVRGDYDRASKRFSIYKFENINAERFIKGSALVSTDINF